MDCSSYHLSILYFVALQVYVQEVPDPRKVSVSGPAFDGHRVTFEPTQFTIDCTNAGPGKLSHFYCSQSFN
jgi:hypothetical protein